MSLVQQYLNHQGKVGYYVNYDHVFSFNRRHMFLTGDRGVGKTYGGVEWLIRRAVYNDEKFIFVRMTDKALEELVSLGGLGFLADHPKRLDLNPEDFRIQKRSLYYQEKIIGAFIPLSLFFNIKGINYDEFTNFYFDEFIPERGEAQRVDYLYALQSIMQTVFRERVDFRAIYSANELDGVNDILDFFGFNITPYFKGQRMQRSAKKLSAVIFYLQNIKELRGENNDDTEQGDAFATSNKQTKSNLILNYENNIDKDCAANLKRKEIMAYLNGDRTFFALRDYNGKVAVIALKKLPDVLNVPCYSLHKRFVHGATIYDNKFKQQLLSIWNSNLFVFKNTYSLQQFMKGLFAQ